MSNKQVYAPVREFLRNYKHLVVKQETIIITKNGKPEGVYVPYGKWGKNDKQMPTNKPKKFILTDLEKYFFKGGDPNLSQNIDKILYG